MYYSECCGEQITSDGLDYSICPDCGEHCTILEIDDNGNEREVEL